MNKDKAKVKPQAGQAWKCVNSIKLDDIHKGMWITIKPNDTSFIKFDLPSGPCMTYSEDSFLGNFEFAPASILEKLALLVEYWKYSECGFVYLASEGLEMYVTSFQKDQFNGRSYYTPGQIKECRYQLGLEQEGTTMDQLDLSNSEVDDIYIDESGNKFPIALVGDKNAVIKSNSGHYIAVNFCGTGPGALQLVKKHDERWWLSELPPADIFCKSFISISCGKSGEWHMNRSDGFTPTLLGLKMPKLKGDEWTISGIDIKDLAAFQSKGKE